MYLFFQAKRIICLFHLTFPMHCRWQKSQGLGLTALHLTSDDDYLDGRNLDISLPSLLLQKSQQREQSI